MLTDLCSSAGQLEGETKSQSPRSTRHYCDLPFKGLKVAVVLQPVHLKGSDAVTNSLVKGVDDELPVSLEAATLWLFYVRVSNRCTALPCETDTML